MEAIAKQAKLSKKQASSALAATLDSISDAMKKGQKVALVGFGTFGAV
ncbi:HU family DNA-binding protein, partial [bacterium]|nr:HU family DNA-binding protein [bacterium]